MPIRILYAATVFLSALLLFLVQPMIAKAILPWFGGSAGVWTTCMLFFQVTLLLGYWYAHWATRRLRPKLQVTLHAGLLVASLMLLPVTASEWWRPSGNGSPVLRILGLLAASAGLPYFLLSTTSPLVQVWYARRFAGELPYRLFAISNAASLLALLAYPFAIEPWLSNSMQLETWSVAYASFVALAAWSAITGRNGLTETLQSQSVPWPRRLLWIGLAASPSALWLAVANQMSQSVAAVPLLWILPLSTYLLTLILCFHRDEWYRPRLFRWLTPLAVVALIAASKQHMWSARILWGLLLFIGGLFILCMFCHGEMVRRKPETGNLTSFYLMVALGGAAGAVLVGVVSPLIFVDYLEFLLSIIACVILALVLLYGYSSKRHPWRLALVSAAAIILSSSFQRGSQFRGRNFYGILEVNEGGQGENAYRDLYNGTILHGSQFLSSARSREATTYYSPESAVGIELGRMAHAGRRVGVIGLGAGTLAAYAEKGDYFRFYEINPLVVAVANNQFRFLRDCRGKVDVVTGDARLALEREKPQNFDLLAVDAFSGDAVPVHLLTKEAFELYFHHVRETGAVAVHVSSKYLNLAPIVVKIGESLGKDARVVESKSDLSNQVMSALWVILKGSKPPVAGVRVWTDQYSNLLAALK
jgi:hypothetical protein